MCYTDEAKNATLVLDDEIEDLSGSGGVCEDNPHLLDARASIQVEYFSQGLLNLYSRHSMPGNFDSNQ